ncbi:FAS1-like dehydratase domain-containing protein [Nocardia aurea]|uniref:MaoC family dehydratase N-terminal domain-containing protein n=1 Tax=Nocardia aurea TaxID=2144174 RepID=A0ABV3FX89_9NOCA
MSETIPGLRRTHALRSARAAEVVPSPVVYRHLTTGPHPIHGDPIREFSRAVRHVPTTRRSGLPDGYDSPTLVAPPSYTATVLTPVLRDILAEFVPDGAADRILHVDQVIEFRRPVVEGDRLTCRTAVEAFRHFADYHVLSIKSVLVDRQGAVKQTATTSLLTRMGGASGHPSERRVVRGHVCAARTHESAAKPRPITLDGLTVGSELPRWDVELTRDDLTGYARLTGATDATPSTIELALVSTYLGNAVGGDTGITRLRTQAARHTHYLGLPAPDSTTLRFHGHVTAVDVKHRRASVAVTVRADDRGLFSYAAADLRLPD